METILDTKKDPLKFLKVYISHVLERNEISFLFFIIYLMVQLVRML